MKKKLTTGSFSRKEFLKGLPRHLMQGFQGIAGGCFELSVTPEFPTEEVNSDERIAFVDINECLAWGGMSCQFCYLACPLRDCALKMIDQKPVVVSSSCDGCGLCMAACQTIHQSSAIKLMPSERINLKGKEGYDEINTKTTQDL